MEKKRKIKLLLDYKGSKVTHDYNDINNCDYHLLEETTTDGYSVYVFKEPFADTILCENVYYYNHNLGSYVIEALMEESTTVFIDEWEYNDLYIEDQLMEEFEEYVDEILQDETLPVQDVKELMEEYDIELDIEL